MGTTKTTLGSKPPDEEKRLMEATKAYCLKEEVMHSDLKKLKNIAIAKMTKGMPRVEEAMAIAEVLRKGLKDKVANINLGLDTNYPWTSDEALDIAEVKTITSPEIAMDVFHGLVLFRAMAELSDSRTYFLDERSDIRVDTLFWTNY